MKVKIVKRTKDGFLVDSTFRNFRVVKVYNTYWLHKYEMDMAYRDFKYNEAVLEEVTIMRRRQCCW